MFFHPRKECAMNKKRNQLFKKVLSFILAITLCLSTHFSLVVNAKNTDQKKKDLENELSKLNNDKDKLIRELSKSAASLKSITQEIEAAQISLGTAKAREIGQYELMKKRIKYIYETNAGNLFTMLLEAESIADLLNRRDFITYISTYDREMLKKFQQIHQDVQEKEAKLLKQQKALTEQRKDLSNKYAKLTSLITATSDDLAAYEKQLEEAKKAAEESDKLLENTKPKPKPDPKPENKPNEKPGDSKPDSKPDKPSPPSNIETVALFAGILECEAGSTDYDALLAVATVIMNRVESSRYPDTIKDVIYQSGQFSPTWSGRLDKVLERGPKPLCYKAAKDALAGARYEAVKDCYSFRSSNSGVDGITVGGNTFF